MRKNKSNIIKTDILIAGGGPSGCTLAAILGKAGVDVTCVDTDNPQDIESKEREFDHAAYGMIGLETCFGLILTTNKKMALPQLLDKISRAPRNIVALEVPAIKEGALANLSLFSPNTKWEFKAHHIQSKSKNTPFIGKELQGKVYGIVNKNQFFKN